MSNDPLNEHARIEFCCTYEFDGKKWGVNVWADTHEEAEMKLRAMANGTVNGRVTDKIPANGLCPTCGQETDRLL